MSGSKRISELYKECKRYIGENEVPCGGCIENYHAAKERNSKRAMEAAIFLYEKELEENRKLLINHNAQEIKEKIENELTKYFSDPNL